MKSLPLSSKFYREPLLQFLVLALVVFAIDQIAINYQDNPRNIVVDDNQLQDLVDLFREGQGRDPSAQEVNNLIVKWTQNEILYREAQLMDMDQGDEMIRSRLILKMRNVLFNRVIVDAPTDSELKTFFEFNRDSYDTPIRYDFEQASLPSIYDSEQARSLAGELGNAALPAELEPKLWQYAMRPETNLKAMYGAAQSSQLLNAEPGNWQVIELKTGLALARVTKIHDPEPARLEEVRNQVIKDWKKFRNDIQLADQTKALADKYTIKLDLSPSMSAKLPPLVAAK